MHNPGEGSKTINTAGARGNVLLGGPTGRKGAQIGTATNTKEPSARDPSTRYS